MHSNCVFSLLFNKTRSHYKQQKTMFLAHRASRHEMTKPTPSQGCDGVGFFSTSIY